MTEIKMSESFSAYVNKCKFDASDVIEKAAIENDDEVFAYVHLGDKNFDKFAPLSTMDQNQYYKHLWKRTIAPLSVVVFLGAATVLIPYYNPATDLNFSDVWMQYSFFGLMALFFAVVFLNFRLNKNWFKRHGYDLDQANKVYKEAVKTVGFGKKGIYFLNAESRDKADVLLPKLVVHKDEYSNITQFKLNEDEDKNTLIIESKEIKNLKIFDPETDYHDGLFEEVEDLIENNKKA